MESDPRAPPCPSDSHHVTLSKGQGPQTRDLEGGVDPCAASSRPLPHGDEPGVRPWRQILQEVAAEGHALCITCNFVFSQRSNP